MTQDTSFTATSAAEKLTASTQGRFGDRAEIDSNSRRWYLDHGVPAELYDQNLLHPVAESIAELRALGSDNDEWEASLAFAPMPSMSVDSPADVLDNSHPADKQMDVEVESRLSCDLVDPQSVHGAFDSATAELVAYGAEMAIDAVSYQKRARIVSDSAIVGGSWTDLVGLTYFGQKTMSDPFAGAESMLHECLHSKAQRVTRGFQRTFLQDDAEETLEIPWWRTGSSRVHWNYSRAFDAFHVYSHISVLAASKYVITEDTQALGRCKTAAFRAAFLYALLQTAPEDQVDPDRRDMIEWVQTIAIPPFGLTDSAKYLLRTPVGF